MDIFSEMFFVWLMIFEWVLNDYFGCCIIGSMGFLLLGFGMEMNEGEWILGFIVIDV